MAALPILHVFSAIPLCTHFQLHALFVCYFIPFVLEFRKIYEKFLYNTDIRYLFSSPFYWAYGSPAKHLPLLMFVFVCMFACVHMSFCIHTRMYVCVCMCFVGIFTSVFLEKISSAPSGRNVGSSSNERISHHGTFYLFIFDLFLF